MGHPTFVADVALDSLPDRPVLRQGRLARTYPTVSVLTETLPGWLTFGGRPLRQAQGRLSGPRFHGDFAVSFISQRAKASPLLETAHQLR
jgi:hypothetical protein